MRNENRYRAYWKKTRVVTFALFASWALLTFGTAYFARELSLINMPVLGFPVSFYMAAQGLPLIYIFIVFFYWKRMQRLDAEFGMKEEEQ